MTVCSKGICTVVEGADHDGLSDMLCEAEFHLDCLE